MGYNALQKRGAKGTDLGGEFIGPRSVAHELLRLAENAGKPKPKPDAAAAARANRIAHLVGRSRTQLLSDARRAGVRPRRGAPAEEIAGQIADQERAEYNALTGAGRTHGAPGIALHANTQAAEHADDLAHNRDRLNRINAMRPVSNLLTQVDELHANGASDRAMSHRIESLGRVNGASPEVTRRLTEAANSGDRQRLLETRDELEREHGLERVGDAGRLAPFSRTEHEMIAGTAQPAEGTPVNVVRPGYVARSVEPSPFDQNPPAGGGTRLSRATVERLSPAEFARQQDEEAAAGRGGDWANGLQQRVAERDLIEQALGRELGQPRRRGTAPNPAAMRQLLIGAGDDSGRRAALQRMGLNQSEARTIARDLGVPGQGRADQAHAIDAIVRHFSGAEGGNIAPEAGRHRVPEINEPRMSAEQGARIAHLAAGARRRSIGRPSQGMTYSGRVTGPGGENLGTVHLRQTGEHVAVSRDSATVRNGGITEHQTRREAVLALAERHVMGREAEQAARRPESLGSGVTVTPSDHVLSSHPGAQSFNVHHNGTPVGDVHSGSSPGWTAFPPREATYGLTAHGRGETFPERDTAARALAMAHEIHTRPATPPARPAPARPPRGAVASALARWREEGKGAQNPLKGLRREQLRTYARQQGIDLPNRVPDDRLREAILSHARGGSGGTTAARDRLDQLSDRDVHDLAAEHGVAEANSVHRSDPQWTRQRELAALRQAGANVRADHPGLPENKGRSGRPSASSRIGLLLNDWSKGNGSDDPLAEHDFTVGELRAAARQRGVQVSSSDNDADIRRELYAHTRTEFRENRTNVENLPSPDQVLKRGASGRAARQVYEGSFAGMRTHVTQVASTGQYVNVEGTIHDADGRQIGTFNRILQRDGGKLKAYHAYLQLNGTVQGNGFSNAFNGHLLNYYRQHGVSEVSVHANIDVGGYTWAQFGYNFASRSDADRMVTKFQQALDQLQRGGNIDRAMTGKAARDRQSQIDALKSLLDRARTHQFGQPGYPSAYDFSQAGRWEGAGGRRDVWVGKALMLGSNWHGVIHLQPRQGTTPTST